MKRLDANDVKKAGGTRGVAQLVATARKRDNARENPKHWENGLAYIVKKKKGKPGKPDETVSVIATTAANVSLILQHHPLWAGSLGFDEMRQTIVWLQSPPEIQGLQSPEINFTMAETDWIGIQQWLLLIYGATFRRDVVEMGAMKAAEARKFHPVRDYLDSLEWDGTPRLDTMLIRHGGAMDSKWVKVATSKTMIAAVARARKPGCKVDTTLVLESAKQGEKKSWLMRVLAGEAYFSDNLGDVSQKDAQLHLNGKWIVEIAELDALRKAENSRVKSFLSRQVDQYRPPYGRRDVYVPRSCIFVGTTNSSEYLTDASGGRRFWPIEIPKRIDIEAICAERDQLWAEADARYRQGEPWHLDDDLEREAEIEQERRYRRHPWEDVLREKLAHKNRTTFAECLDFLCIEVAKQTSVHSNEVAKVLRRLHFWPGPRTTEKDPDTGRETRPRWYVRRDDEDAPG